MDSSRQCRAYTTKLAHYCNSGVLCTDGVQICGYLCYNSECEKTVTHMKLILTDE